MNAMTALDILTPGWTDKPNALELLERATLLDWQRQALHDLVVNGFAHLQNVADPDLCDAVVRDYAAYSEQNAAYVANNLDTLGREKRLVNFHLWSDSEMKVVTNSKVMEVLDLFFGERASVYTSLTFKYGTQQPIHRDTPHFATWPQRRYCGMWTALEDIHPDAGPLMYIKGGHRFEIDHYAIARDVEQDFPDIPVHERRFRALDIYNGRVIDEAPRNGELTVATLKKGDVVIWHPECPHGGTPAVDPYMSRWSVVAHCAPETVQVHQHEQFFGFGRETEPPARYGFGEAYGRKIAVSGPTAFM